MGKQETLIRINQKYVIAIDSLNYTLQKAYKTKKGNDCLRIIGHYPSMEKALTSCRNEMVKDELFKNDVSTLDDAILAIARYTNRLEAAVKHNFEGVTA